MARRWLEDDSEMIRRCNSYSFLRKKFLPLGEIYVQGPKTPVQSPWTVVSGPEMENISRGKKKSPSGEKESLRFKVYSFLQSGVQTLGASGQAER